LRCLFLLFDLNAARRWGERANRFFSRQARGRLDRIFRASLGKEYAGQLREDAISSENNLIAPVDAKLHGAAIIAAIKQSGVQTVVTVPDRTTASGLLRPISQDNELRHVLVSKEDEALAISAALSFCDHRALCLFQYTGLLDSINAVRAVAVEYAMPICMMVGLLGKEPGVAPTESKHYGVSIIEPILDAMGVAHVLIECDDDIAAIVPAIDEAYKNSCPIVLLIGRPPIAPGKEK
jgi:sulfopyruvate decarboxylase subunit alpha